ncbi:Anaerobic dehydrogenases, typically selenocysteine-containing [Olavius algarvensis Delta 1 endosymbiont]|nr:Anaerobic dehydrogenases, typically selenocysteine-containing [Olavius algarvensis Delta 1 endosymbiont]
MAVHTVIENGVVPTLCRQCDMRCGINCHIREGRLTKITGLAEDMETQGRLCPKAPAAVDLLYHPDRLVTPLKRCASGSFEPITYAEAMAQIAAAMQGIKHKHGARSMGVWTGEAIGFQQQENYARRFIHAFGSPNYFSAESVCWVARYLAYRMTQGYYNPCPDFARARLIVLWGANPSHSHPPYMWAINRALKKGARLLVIDPRRTAAARQAHRFLQIQPGTDAALAWGIIRQLIRKNSYDHEFVANHTLGFDELAGYCRTFTSDFVAGQTGLSTEAVRELGDLFAAALPRVANYPGISMEHQTNGVNTIRVIAALGGLCGAVDQPGADVWPESLVQSEMPLYHELPLDDLDPIGRSRFPALYNFRKQCHSLSAMDVMLDRGAYPLRGLIVTGANPVLTNPNTAKVERALDRLDLLVVRDLFMTATARRAHYVLPAASFLERSELHVYTHRQAVALANKVARVDGTEGEYAFWHDLAHRTGIGAAYFPWQDETAVNRWLLKPSGIALETLQDQPQGMVYAPQVFNKFRRQPLPTASGRFEFVSAELAAMGHPGLPIYTPPKNAAAFHSAFPLVLITGARHALYYHSRFRNIPRLRRVKQPVVEINAGDAAQLGIKNGELVRIETEIGFIELAAAIMTSEDILPGVIQIGHGWDEANVNRLTDDRDLDPISGCPNMKRVAARVVKLV